jgi:hypothetical protein
LIIHLGHEANASPAHQGDNMNNRIVTAEMVQHLPEPAQRYMNYTRVVGKAWIETVRIKYSGVFRLGADKPWMPIKAEQFYTTNPPGFHWKARFKMFGLWMVSGSDTYKAGHGHMFGKIAGLYTIFNARGDELDQGTMMRYLNEMTWFPIALLGDNVTWQAVDDRSFDVTFTDCDKSVTARFITDETGRLTNFITKRYRENNGTYILDTWTTPMTEYGQFAGLNLPIRGQAVWKLPTGDLPYADFTLSEVEYNGAIEEF